ncbi:LysR substrate-binding domain-containing protein [Larsenimonas salina]|nr:LysR substrate-binding domain-containing protein [Larsenimonas salina]MCM5705095.1 LysR substrate-binding domain-containing protein [Larsenimonas salina]
MSRRLPPLNWLRSFEAAARHLSFTRAANELHMTQAAISQHIKGLESQLSVSLFKRLPQGLVLSDAGLAYLPAIHEAIERLSAATEELFGQGRPKLITIRASLVFFTTWLAPRLARFRALHPNIDLRFTSNIWAGEGYKDADMEIRYGQGGWSGMTSERLTWDELFPVCRPGMFKCSAQLSSLEALSGQTLLHVIGYEEGWGYWLKKTGGSHFDTRAGLQFDTLISALEAAAQGIGIALGRSSLVEDMIARGRLEAPFGPRISTSEAFHLVYSSHHYLHPHAAAFRAWLLDEAGMTHGDSMFDAALG